MNNDTSRITDKIEDAKREFSQGNKDVAFQKLLDAMEEMAEFLKDHPILNANILGQ